MREYAKKPERVSRTLDSKPKASKQAPVLEILERKVGRETVVSQPLMQGKFQFKEGSIGEFMQTLAESTETGRAGLDADAQLSQELQTRMEQQGGRLEVKDSGWKVLTKESIGVGIDKADYDILASLKTTTDRMKVQVAHEMTHLRHYIQDPVAYSIRGESTLKPTGDWDSDPEEQLTVKGTTSIPKADWDAAALRALRAATFELVNEQSRAKGIMESGKNQVIRDRAKKKFEDLSKQINSIGEEYKKAPVRATLMGDDYVFTDQNAENSAREGLGYLPRLSYADVSMSKIPPSSPPPADTEDS